MRHRLSHMCLNDCPRSTVLVWCTQQQSVEVQSTLTPARCTSLPKGVRGLLTPFAKTSPMSPHQE
eukprot:2710199-Amphidinium_carterae.1